MSGKFNRDWLFPLAYCLLPARSGAPKKVFAQGMEVSMNSSSDGNNNRSSPGKYLTSFQRKLLQKSLQDNLPEFYRQRIQIMLLADEDKTQAQICQIVKCSQSTARHWMLMAETGQAHQWQKGRVGRPKSLPEEYLERLRELVEESPKEHGYAFGRWTAQWLGKHLEKEFGVQMSSRHINRLLRQMGLSTRPQCSLAQDIRHQQPAEKRILIYDLQTAHSADSHELWQFNPLKMR
jgi:transposase